MGTGGVVAGAIGRGEVRLLSIPSPGQTKACRRTHEGERYRLFICRHGGANHFHNPRCALRSPPDGEDGMKGTCAINLHNLVTVSKARLGPG